MSVKCKVTERQTDKQQWCVKLSAINAKKNDRQTENSYLITYLIEANEVTSQCLLLCVHTQTATTQIILLYGNCDWGSDKQRVIKVAGTQLPACPPPLKRPRESKYINYSFSMCRWVCVCITYLLTYLTEAREVMSHCLLLYVQTDDCYIVHCRLYILLPQQNCNN